MDNMQGQFGTGEELFHQDILNSLDFSITDMSLFDSLPLADEWEQNNVLNTPTADNASQPSTNLSNANTPNSYYESPNTNISASPEMKVAQPAQQTNDAAKANGKGGSSTAGAKTKKVSAPSSGVKKEKAGQRKRGRKPKVFHNAEEEEEDKAKGRERNRNAAAKCRQKKKKEQQNTQVNLNKLVTENECLKVDLSLVKTELINLYEFATSIHCNAAVEASGIANNEVVTYLESMKQRLGDILDPLNVASFREECRRQAAADAAEDAAEDAAKMEAEAQRITSASVSPALSNLSLGGRAPDQAQVQAHAHTHAHAHAQVAVGAGAGAGAGQMFIPSPVQSNLSLGGWASDQAQARGQAHAQGYTQVAVGAGAGVGVGVGASQMFIPSPVQPHLSLSNQAPIQSHFTISDYQPFPNSNSPALSNLSLDDHAVNSFI